MTSQIDPAAIRADIEQVRNELAATISALAKKADVRSRVEHRVYNQVKTLVVKTEGLTQSLDTGWGTAKKLALPPIKAAMANPKALVPSRARGVLVSMLLARLVRGARKR